MANKAPKSAPTAPPLPNTTAYAVGLIAAAAAAGLLVIQLWPWVPSGSPTAQQVATFYGIHLLVVGSALTLLGFCLQVAHELGIQFPVSKAVHKAVVKAKAAVQAVATDPKDGGMFSAQTVQAVNEASTAASDAAQASPAPTGAGWPDVISAALGSAATLASTPTGVGLLLLILGIALVIFSGGAAQMPTAPGASPQPS